MISKEQAVLIADSILADSKNESPTNSKISRENNKLFVAIVFLLLTFRFFGHHYQDMPIWLIAMLCLCVLLFMATSSYQFYTPLVEIKRDKFVYFGYWPWSKRVFPLQEITKVTFTPQLQFWRSARSLRLQLVNGEFKIWVPGGFRSFKENTGAMLRANFGEKYTEQ